MKLAEETTEAIKYDILDKAFFALAVTDSAKKPWLRSLKTVICRQAIFTVISIIKRKSQQVLLNGVCSKNWNWCEKLYETLI
jgi:hypothetical protein